MPIPFLMPKDIRKLAHRIANQNPQNTGKMMAAAIEGPRIVRGASGSVNTVVTATDPFAKYLDEFAEELPWKELTPFTQSNGGHRAFSNCAEAHVWLELKGRGLEPKKFTVVAFNSRNVIASPCPNCSQWVGQAFGGVYQQTPSYTGRRRQKP